MAGEVFILTAHWISLYMFDTWFLTPGSIHHVFSCIIYLTFMEFWFLLEVSAIFMAIRNCEYITDLWASSLN